MKRLFYIFFVVFCLPVFASGAESYYVTQSGAGSKNGTSLANAWDASQFNALSGAGYAGDTIYFSGTFTTRIEVYNIYGTSGNPVVLDGYEAGDCDPINDCDEGDFTCDGNTNSSAILLKGIDVGGNIEGPDYINIQDFRMTRDDGKHSTFRILGDVSEGDDEKHCDYINVKRNFVYESDGPMFYYYSGRYSTIEDNKFFVFGQTYTDVTHQGVDLIETDDLIFRGNEVGHDETSYPSGCTSGELIELHGCNRILIEYNDCYGAPQQAGIRPKEWGGTHGDIIIRFNKVHDNVNTTSGKGIYLRTSVDQALENIYIYGNYIYNNGIDGIMFGRNVSNIHIWSNLITDNGKYGIETWNDPAPSDMYIYNNTLARNGDIAGDTRGGIVLTVGSGIYVKNNIFWNNQPSGVESKYYQFYSSITPSALDYNTLYHSSSTDLWYYSSGERNLAWMIANTAFCDNSAVEDPTFTNPDGDDYTLTAAGTAGEDLSECFYVVVQGKTIKMCYEHGIDDDMDWMGDAKDLLDNANEDANYIPTYVANRNDYNSGTWGRGAYVYGTGGSETDAPTPNPATFSSAPAGASTTSIDMTATTGSDVNTISIQFDFDPDSDNCGSHADIGTGGSDRTWTEEDYTHTDDGLDVNQYYCYKCQMRDSIPNTGTASSLAGCYTLAAVPGAPTLSAGTDTNTQISFDALDENGNPTATPDTDFACQVTDSSPYDSAWHGKYIDPDDTSTPSAAAVWKTNSDWDGLGDVDGFNSNTAYKIACKARDGDNTETALSTEAEITTDYPPGSGEDETVVDIHITNLKLE